jgi:hypothetical protein
LTALAAAGLMIVTSSASVFHLLKGESAIATVVLFVLAILVACLRRKVAPIAARNRA